MRRVRRPRISAAEKAERTVAPPGCRPSSVIVEACRRNTGWIQPIGANATDKIGREFANASAGRHSGTAQSRDMIETPEVGIRADDGPTVWREGS